MTRTLILPVRTARPEDANGIAQVHVQSWRETYSGIVPQAHLDGLQVETRQKMWEGALASSQSSVHVTEANGDVVGFACFGPAREKGFEIPGELFAIYLLRAFQGHGTGQALFESARKLLGEQGHASFYLWVLEANPTRRFYERQGGRAFEKKTVEIGGAPLLEIAYRFDA